MEIFFAHNVSGGFAHLDAEESAHCVRVLRRRVGDAVDVIDGSGALFRCELCDDSPKAAVARILGTEPEFGAHPYYLRMAVCPTKNIDRYEWFVEKAVELGVDEIVPVIGERSERRVVRVDRLRKLVLSAVKQSLKGRIPTVAEPLPLTEFVAGMGASSPESTTELRLICYCSDEVRARGSAVDIINSRLAGLQEASGKAGGIQDVPAPGELQGRTDLPSFTIMVGPEGDFSPEEVRAAMASGFIPVHLGPSRLRTETAAVSAVEAVYLMQLNHS